MHLYDYNNETLGKNQDEHVFQDKRKDGKEVPWRDKKLMNLSYAEYLTILEFKKANNVTGCAEVLKFRKTSEGNYKLYQTWFCKSKLCPLCNWRRAMKNSNQVEKIITESVKREPKGRWLFLTLTVRNVFDGDELGKSLKEITKGFRRLMNYKKVSQNLIGFLRTTEITVNKVDNSYNQHIHVLIFVKSAYFNTKGAYISQKDWTQFWKKAMKLDYDPVVNIKAVKPNPKKSKSKNDLKGVALETAKYSVKSSDYLTGNDEENLKVIQDLETGLYKKRQISYGGLLKEIHKELHLDDIEDGNLIQTDDDSLNEKIIAEEIIAKWNFERKNYYIR